MSGFFCRWWDCPLEQVSEHQQADCERNGMDCRQCMERADEEERQLGADCGSTADG